MATSTNNYKTDVLAVNAAMKIEQKSLNGAIRVLLLLAPLKPYQKTKLQTALKDTELYTDMAAKVANKKGNYSPFRVLLYIHQNSK